MPRSKPVTTDESLSPLAGGAPFRILLVDEAAHVRRLVTESLAGVASSMLCASSLAEARRWLDEAPVDLALIDAHLPDGAGLELLRQLDTGRSCTQAILMTDQPTLENALEAIRAGAADFLIKPFKAGELSERVRQAIVRHRAGRQARQRIERLRRICKKLNQARDEVSQQVDILCNDLVSAYQELATQMNQVQQMSRAGDYASLIHNELDLEAMLRRTLEYLLQKAGPTNAAIFLPANADEYTLGGYVNYECTAESADMLLQHLADVVAPKVAGHEGLVHITDNAALAQWIGDDSAYLADSHVLTFACRHRGEPLAVLTLFRDGSQPFDAAVVETCAALGVVLAEHLAKLIRIHHRSLPMDEPE